MLRCILLTGTLSVQSKTTVDTTLIKKKGIEPIKNYRPISNLQFISKITEKDALAGFVSHMKRQNSTLVPDYQSAYVKLLMNHNRLKINESKTEAIILVSKKLIGKVDIDRIQVDESTVDMSHQVKYLDQG